MRANDAGTRCRCKVVLTLVQGRTPTMIAQGGLCAKSQVYRVAGRFIIESLAGLANRREDNGERKITPVYERELLSLVEQLPQDFGYRRPTWTQELLILVPAERVEISISVSAMSRLLRGRSPESGLKWPKPIVSCPWKKGKVVGLADCGQSSGWSIIFRLTRSCCTWMMSSLSSIQRSERTGPKRGRQKMVKLTPGCNEEALSGWCMESSDAPAHLCRRRAEEQPAVPGTAPHIGHEGLSERQADSPHPRQLWYPRQFASAVGNEVGRGRKTGATLLAAILSGP